MILSSEMLRSLGWVGCHKRSLLNYLSQQTRPHNRVYRETLERGCMRL